MKKWWLVMALLLSVGVNIGMLVGRATAPIVDLPPPPPDDGPPPGSPDAPKLDRVPPFVHRMADELRLRGAGRDAFIERQRRFLEDTLAARARFADLQDRLRRELIAHEPNREAADALLEEMGAAHAELERVFVDNLFDTRELLDPQQQRLYLRFLQRFRQAQEGPVLRRLREGLQRRGGPPPGRDRPWRDRERPDRDGPHREEPPKDTESGRN